MKRLTVFVLIPAFALACDLRSGELRWLEGCWVSPEKNAQEVWVIEGDRSLIGFSVAFEANQIGFYELLNLERNTDGIWTYTAYPSGQPSASFTAVEVTENSVVFVNPDHDYPQEINYTMEDGHLVATISLLGGANARSFSKIPCE